VPPPQGVVRHVVLEIINNTIGRLDRDSLLTLKDRLMEYTRRTFPPGSQLGNVDSPLIQNKLTQTLTYLFAYLYPSGWETFFDDFRDIAGNQENIATVNVAGTFFYLRILGSVHDEFADQLVLRSPEEQKRGNELKDLIRDRDVQKIAACWGEILNKWNETDLQLIETCLKTISRWVSWIDINLVISQPILGRLFETAGQQMVTAPNSPQNRVRDASIETFTEMVGKGMKPEDKIALIEFLDLRNVVGQLVESPALKDLRVTPQYDTDFAETVAKLVNVIATDVVKVLDHASVSSQVRQQAQDLIIAFIPYLLRFFSDEYDEVCSTVIAGFSDVLNHFRSVAKAQGSLPPEFGTVISPALDAIVMKMKYDETASWGDEEEATDEAEFQALRKSLRNLQQIVAELDQSLFMEAVSRLITDTLERLGAKDSNLDWRDLDLALHEIYLFGELAIGKTGLYVDKQPSSPAAQRLVEVVLSMVESGKLVTI
jgi:exportin-T